MSADANQEQTQTETTVTETPAAQPDTQGSVSPSQTTEPDAGSAQQAQGEKNQQPQMIPKWRFDEVNEQLKALRQQQPQQAQPQKPQGNPGNQPPKEEDFNGDFQAYYDARAAWIADQRYEQRRQAEQQQAQSQKWNERVETAETKFSEKLFEATAKNPALMQKLQNAPSLRGDLQLALKESDAPIALAEHLADNPGLVLQLNQMTPDRSWRELGKIEARLAGSSGQPPKKPSAGIPALDAVGAGQKPGPKHVDQYSQDDVIARLYPTS